VNLTAEDHLKIISSRIFVSCLLFWPLPLPAQAPSSDAGLTSNPIFQQNCAKCHGKTAEGRHFGGPSLLSQKVQAASDDDLISIVTNGKGHMPKYVGKISDADIRTLAGQIKNLNKK
jgi:mono/diheme cytochrome c family protein